MNILVTGANGQLGMSIRRAVINSADNYIFTDIKELDITDGAAVSEYLNGHDIDIVVNCAAYTDVERAEDDYDKAELLNATAVKNLAEAIKRRDGLLIHISTDYVFGGGKYNTPIREDAEVNPTGVYGLTKLHGEEYVKESGADAIIIRTAWLYSEYGKNFVKTMLGLTSVKPTLNVVFDQMGSPTYAGDLATAIVGLLESGELEDKEGIYHFSNEGVCSWYDFAKEIAMMSGHDECEIQPCHSDEFPSKVVRPSYSVLDKSKFKKCIGMPIPYWKTSLQKCLTNLNNQKEIIL
ncbi:MAG: dTDP-4-dehydrorhamnose reductase [Muribaculaceae bacterium]|nr:dTDP-4-dehydrorhamnose reductase [Muribaculaceae bacterium]